MKEYLENLKQKIILILQKISRTIGWLANIGKKALTGAGNFLSKIYHFVYAKSYNLFNALGGRLGKIGIKAHWVSWIGFIIGIFAVNFLAMEMYGWALLAILLNRFCDGLDGAIARSTEVTNFGVFLDAALDYIFYGGVIWGFALGNPSQAAAACFLMFGFVAAACAMLAYSVVAYKINSKQHLNLDNSPFYLGGIAQGSETFAVLVLLCLFPNYFTPMATVLGILSLIKAFSVIIAAYYNFVIMDKNKNV
ncbi:MAG: CDP-alcohol phosphatidyltransferase family protein [Alphaproteobacteria bacterium]|nr:CDP-alcohol phosphatidyltransferase family protein [Alphaproteobacteria bacterium]